VNKAFVWGALLIGIGHRQAEDLFAVIDVRHHLSNNLNGMKLL